MTQSFEGLMPVLLHFSQQCVLQTLPHVLKCVSWSLSCVAHWACDRDINLYADYSHTEMSLERLPTQAKVFSKHQAKAANTPLGLILYVHLHIHCEARERFFTIDTVFKHRIRDLQLLENFHHQDVPED